MEQSKLKLIISRYLVLIIFLILIPHSSDASSLAYNLKGQFILEVEAKGEAWYVDNDNTVRHYLPNDYQALLVLRDLSIGMTNENLAKIPIAVDNRFVRFDSDSDGLDDRVELAIASNPRDRDSDGDGYDDAEEIKHHFNILGPGRGKINLAFRDRFLGEIVIQVESHGELWYIHPNNGLRYLIADLEDLNNIIKYLALGISSKDINHIALSSLIKVDAIKNIKVLLGDKQRLYYYLDDVELGSFPVSAGKASTPTPKGNYRIVNKHPKAWSSYGLWMPFWLGLANGRFGFHELPIWPNGYREGEDHLGVPVSHGCIRLGIGPAEYLYNWADIGTAVEIK
ncbi:MAG: murein L,D-transpeptidase [Clostridia bacterium]|nr:murein L,D-transpeptidase [Clostridia bacterium]